MKRALIVGSAPCVEEDLMNAPDWPLIVINFAGIRHQGPIEMWVSLHFRLLVKLIEQRYEEGGDMEFKAYSRVPISVPPIKAAGGVTVEPCDVSKVGIGSSGLLAVMCAINDGYERLILCGCPLDGDETIQANEKIEVRSRGRRDLAAFARFRAPWMQHAPLIKGHVRSMSGWTRELLGGPEEWIGEPYAATVPVE